MEGDRAIHPEHPYRDAGEYNITLTVRDNLGVTNYTTMSITVHPPNMDQLLSEGVNLASNGECEAAIAKFDAVLQQNGSYGLALYYKGFCLNRLGRSDEALESLDRLLNANTNDSFVCHAWHERSNALRNLSSYDEALESSNKSIELNCNLWYIYYDRGILFNDMSQFQNAVDAFDKALSLNPSDSDRVEIVKLRDEALAKIPKPSEIFETTRVASLAAPETTWNSFSFFGFYYDLDDDIGSEQITFRLSDIASDKSSATLSGEPDGEGQLGVEYRTQAQQKDFEFKSWGRYELIGFMGEGYLASYDSTVTQSMTDSGETEPYLYGKSDDKSCIARKQLSRICIDDNSEITVTSGTPLELEEGYVLAIKSIDVDGNKVYLELSKDGSAVDSKVISPSKDGSVMADKTYYYKKDLGDARDMVIIAVHFKNAFTGAGQNLATVDGIWQVSDAATQVSAGTEYGKMSVSSIPDDAIVMDNRDNRVTLSRNKNVPLMGDINIITSDQKNIDATNPLRYYLAKEESETGAYEIRGSVASGSFEWNAKNFAGLYYDINDNLGTEKIVATISEGNILQEPDGIVYTTSAEKKSFNFADWGYYNVIGFMSDKYFAGYINDENVDDASEILFDESVSKGLLSDYDQIEAVLIDDKIEETVSSSTHLKLKEGYELAIKSIDDNMVYLELSKDGEAVDSGVVSPSKNGSVMADKTYCYRKDAGGARAMVIIAVHFKNAFRGDGQNLATVDGVWQISEAPNDVGVDTQYDKMRVASITADTITMDNKDNTLTLSRNKDITLMGDLHIRTADADGLRYYLYKQVTV